MFPRIRDRLKALEARIAPKSRIFVFFRAEGPDLPPYAEQLAAYKAKKCVVTTDILLIVSFQQGSEGGTIHELSGMPSLLGIRQFSGSPISRDRWYYNTSSCYRYGRRAVGRVGSPVGLEGILRFALAFLACCFALNQVARGAEIKATPIPGLLDTAMITLSGEIESSDAEQFRAAVATYPKAIVAFQSPGGDLIAGIEIGTQIRLRNYMTLVPTGVQCASACALAWLGGTKRLMGSGALIGFHAASVHENGQAIETGAGNALLGAYLNKLGLPDRAVVFVTQAHPNEITWLTMADAEREGIDVSLFPMPGEAPNAAPDSVANTAPSSPSQPTPPPSAPLPSIPVRWYEGYGRAGQRFRGMDI